VLFAPKNKSKFCREGGGEGGERGVRGGVEKKEKKN
jgi:hypothetical protein